MNLILRITLLFVIVSLCVFLIGGYISYHVMMHEINQEQQRFLIERLNRIERVIDRQEPRDTIRWGKLIVIPLKDFHEERKVFSDTLVMHAQLDRIEPHLKLDVIKNVNGRSYWISLFDIVIEPDDIREGLQKSLITMYLILLGAVLIISFLASYFILRPFNHTLSLIKNFSLKDPSSTISFPRSAIVEFDRLNVFLSDMTKKVQADYQALKEFSENASHEMQTPIAIIQAKLEMLLESSNLNETEINQVVAAQNTIKRLSSMGHSLSLITKIDNREFVNVEEVHIQEVLSGMLTEFQELFDLKSLIVEIVIDEDPQPVLADKVLIELMITNIINNAIRHNWEKGSVKIYLKSRELKVINTGPRLEFNPDEVFHRFKKSNQSAQSLGLGLAIVKKICDLYAFTIHYSNDADLHTVHITF